MHLRFSSSFGQNLSRFLGLVLVFSFAFRGPSAQAKIGLHYQPPGGYFGDPIPYFHDGVHHLFFLNQGWAHLVSRDLVFWEDMGMALVPDENDRNIATGSIIEYEGQFQAFYTTSDRNDTGTGLASVRVATSRDLFQWTKEPGLPLLLLKRDVPAVDSYNPYQVWRDPHVFWNPDAKEWWLAIAANEKTNLNYPYSGAVAFATSTDLRNWKVQSEPLLTTREIVASECPDIFPFGDGWAMIYYTDTTRIRLADTPSGPWKRPQNDAPWGLHFQAGKTAFDGERRIIYAYLQRADSDYAKHVYGGCMALPRELYLDEDGAAAVRLVPEVIGACKEDATTGLGANVFQAVKKDPVEINRTTIAFGSKAGTANLALWENAPDDFFFSADLNLSEGASFTMLLRGNATKKARWSEYPNVLDDSYALTFDTHTDQVTLNRNGPWNRQPRIRSQHINLPTDRSCKMYVMLHGDVLEVFVDDRISLCSRVQLSKGALGLLSRDGKVLVSNLRITELPAP